MVQVGDTYTTTKSGVTGRVEKIVPNTNGKTARVLILVEKWTTVPVR